MKKFFTHEVKKVLDNFQIVGNKARQNCFCQAVLGLIKSRKVQLCAIAEAMKGEGDTLLVKSIEHRLGDFFKEVAFDYDKIAMLLSFCLGGQGKIRLCIDRTEWDFGVYQVNILMIVACNGPRHVPLYWELLDNKSGNSGAADRIALLQKAIDLLGTGRIGMVVGDREFIGHGWLKYMKNKGINFCIRVPKNHLLERMDGRKQNVEEIAGPQPLCLKDCMVDGVWVNVYLKKLCTGDFLYLIGTMADPKHLGQVYRKRWTIEATFHSFKSRGFDIESSHLSLNERLKKMVALVSIAFAFCISLGIHHHEKVQKIKIKNHGYKAASFCRTGIDLIKDLCKGSVGVFEKALEKLLRFLVIQKYRYQRLNINGTLLST